ncbi:uncharacterized protein JCM15063_000675 [Sporobolomyces koalae]|uniref:uncharacterized protein n=1 Tax=Sporobolomyces koalae TaxID=500713 RepID=UPI00317C2F6A
MTIAQEINFGYSPSSSADFDEALNPLTFDDEFANEHDNEHDLGLDEDEDDARYEQQSAQTTKPKRSNNRKGPGNAEKRATHNAVERARRESLNGRFTVLAESLPTMKNIKRPSKAMIVNKALDFVYDAQLRERTLVQENNELRQEIDQLRARLGMSPLPPPTPLPQSKPATQATLRKTKKMQFAHGQAESSSASTKAVLATGSASPDGAAPAMASPSIDGAYPSPSMSAYSTSTGLSQSALYDTPTLNADFASSLFPTASQDPAVPSLTDGASSPSSDTLASVASPGLGHPFLPPFDAASLGHPAASPVPSPAFINMFNSSMTQAHLAAAQAGMMPPQAIYAAQTPSYLSNPGLLYAMQQQYLAQQQQHLQQQQQQAHQHQQHPSPASASSPQSLCSTFGQADSTALWAGTPPAWGPFSTQTPSAVDALSF